MKIQTADLTKDFIIRMLYECIYEMISLATVLLYISSFTCSYSICQLFNKEHAAYETSHVTTA